MRIDLGILEFIQTYLRCDLLDMAMPLITRLGDGGILWIGCSFILFLFPRTRKAGASFAAASALYFGRSRIKVPAFILAVLIGFSRLYLYVHYPADVLAGALLGIMLGWLGNILVSFTGEKLHGKLHATA